MKIKTLLNYFFAERKPKLKLVRGFTYRKLLNRLSEMSDEELDCYVMVSENDTMYRVSDLITTSVEIDICDPGDSYFILEN